MYISQSYRGSECAWGHLRSLWGHLLPRYKCIIEFHYARYILAYRSNWFSCQPPTHFLSAYTDSNQLHLWNQIDQMRFFWENTFFSYSNQWVIDNESFQFTIFDRKYFRFWKTSSERKCVLTQSHRNVWLSKSLLMAQIEKPKLVTGWWPIHDLSILIRIIQPIKSLEILIDR